MVRSGRRAGGYRDRQSGIGSGGARRHGVYSVKNLTLAVASLVAMAWPPVPTQPDGLSVTHWARAIQPGEVVVFSISARVPLVSADGRAFGQKLAVFPSGTPGAWQAIAGIDLDTKPGATSIVITAQTERGVTLTAAYPLTVVRKVFPTRRLKVDPRFVTPPSSAWPRIELERMKLAELLAGVTSPRLWAGPFAVPVDGTRVSNFGTRSVYNGRIGSAHRGTDFAAPAGTPVRAPNAGRVVLAEDLYYSGNTIILDHGLGIYSLLAHLSRMDISAGELVEGGAAVGAVGATGRVTGPHLHWTLRVGPLAVDPLSLVEATAVNRAKHGPLGIEPPLYRDPLEPAPPPGVWSRQ